MRVHAYIHICEACDAISRSVPLFLRPTSTCLRPRRLHFSLFILTTSEYINVILYTLRSSGDAGGVAPFGHDIAPGIPCTPMGATICCAHTVPSSTADAKLISTMPMRPTNGYYPRSETRAYKRNMLQKASLRSPPSTSTVGRAHHLSVRCDAALE
jgi:hypothetical protein